MDCCVSFPLFSRNDVYCNVRKQRCETYDTENNWDNYCQKRKINAIYYSDYDKEPEKDPGKHKHSFAEMNLLQKWVNYCEISLNIDNQKSTCRNPREEVYCYCISLNVQTFQRIQHCSDNANKGWTTVPTPILIEQRSMIAKENIFERSFGDFQKINI